MLAPASFERCDLLAIDRAYIDYGKFEELTKRGVVYVTKIKSGLSYEVVSDVMFMDKTKGMTMRIQHVTFTKKEKDGSAIVHQDTAMGDAHRQNRVVAKRSDGMSPRNGVLRRLEASSPTPRRIAQVKS